MKSLGHSDGLGAPLAKPRVALSAASPRADHRAVGFPLQSLTRRADSFTRIWSCTTALFLAWNAHAQEEFAQKLELPKSDPSAFVEMVHGDFVFRADSAFFFKWIIWGSCRGGTSGTECSKLLAEVKTMVQPMDTKGQYRFTPRGRGKKTFRRFLEYQLEEIGMFSVYRNVTMERLDSLYFRCIDQASRCTYYSDPTCTDMVLSYHYQGDM